MKAKFVGIKHISGNRKDNGNAFAFDAGCFLTDMNEHNLKNGSVGNDVREASIPDRFADILCEKNIGKDMEIEFYYTNGRANIAYCALAN